MRGWREGNERKGGRQASQARIGKFDTPCRDGVTADGNVNIASPITGRETEREVGNDDRWVLSVPPP